MADDGFHEIQLNGKQLVFLFMATLVVAVVIFLGGVMVGRDVRVAQGAQEGDGSTSALAADKPLTPGEPGGAHTAAKEAEDLDYYARLGKDTPPPETLAPPAEPPGAGASKTVGAAGSEVSAPAQQGLPSAARPPEPPSPQPDAPEVKAPPPAPAREAPTTKGAAAGAEPKTASGPEPRAPAAQPSSEAGFVVQVAALEERSEAEAILAKLKARNHPAFVLAPSGDKYYRVRVGTYKTRREAEGVMRRLQSEGFKPWITR
jgi:cell division septation protein DedD